jgi:hypothetical protein
VRFETRAARDDVGEEHACPRVGSKAIDERLPLARIALEVEALAFGARVHVEEPLGHRLALRMPTWAAPRHFGAMAVP